MSKNIYIDTETIGVNPNMHALTEVACIVEIDGKEVDKKTFFINPFSYKKEVAITKEALDITGKSEEELKSYPTSAQAFDDFLDFLDEHLEEKKDTFKPIGYNVKFDIDFIKAWFEDNDEEYKHYFSYKDIDVLNLVLTFKDLGYIETKNDKLATLCEYFDIELDAHKAMNDIVATKELYKILTSAYTSNYGKTNEMLSCKNDVIPSEFEKKYDDRLAELEAVIRDYYVAKGFVVKKCDWGFQVYINTMYKDKILVVDFNYKTVFKTTATTTKEMFDKAFEFFSKG